MYALIFIFTLLSFSSPIYADVGCGPRTRPPIEKIDDTGESEDTGDSEDTGEEAKWGPKPMRLAILFGPVLGLAFFARRRE